MSSGVQVDLDWAGTDVDAEVAFGANGAGSGESAAPTAATSQMSDEEILGMDPPSSAKKMANFGGLARPVLSSDGKSDTVGARHAVPLHAESVALAMPAWMQTVAADPKHAGEAQELWREHQAFRAAFSSAEEARAMRELLPGGAQEVQALREAAQEVSSLRQSAASMQEAAQSVERIDAAIFSGDARAQSEVVAEMARANPAAFRSMFAEAAKVLAGMGAGGREAGGKEAGGRGLGDENRRQDAGATNAAAHSTNRGSSDANHESQITNHGSGDTNHQSPVTGHQSQPFDPAAYAAFERSTNETVGRDVRGSISETLGRVLPEGVADGAARRIGEDIFNEVHRALAADRLLSEQVGEVLRDRRFGGGEQQRVASLLAGRAKQLVPSVARRVIGEWTSSVLGTARTKAARQAAAAARVDIAAPGGSLDSMPLRAMSPREVNYSSMSDDEILGM